jgi:hypothetical protein
MKLRSRRGAVLSAAIAVSERMVRFFIGEQHYCPANELGVADKFFQYRELGAV